MGKRSPAQPHLKPSDSTLGWGTRQRSAYGVFPICSASQRLRGDLWTTSFLVNTFRVLC